MFETTHEGADGQHRLTPGSMDAIRHRVAEFVEETGNVGGWEITRDFGTVIVTSDVHADLRKMVQLLVDTKLVAIVGEPGDIYEDVWNVEWIAGDTLFVILGDLVDGKRGRRTVTDPRGSYELLIHVLLFNLRIRARELGSDVLFTIGNHDMFSVMLPTYVRKWPMYTADTHLAFAPEPVHEPDEVAEPATAWEQRAAMLELFYLCSPYLLIRLGSVLLMHGGLLGADPRPQGVTGSCIFDATERAQSAIRTAMVRSNDIGMGTRGVKRALRRYMARTRKRCRDNIIEARGYGVHSEEHICAAEETTGLADDGVELVVAGHCLTHNTEHVRGAECKADKHGDSKVGCVVYFQCNGGPTIALVDVALSECFRSRGSENASRLVQVLKLRLVEEGTKNEGDVYVKGAGKDTRYKLSVLVPSHKTSKRKRPFDSHV
jgi:hypothetical protein